MQSYTGNSENIIGIKMDFVHLHVHTHYSILDSTNQVKSLIEQTKDLGMSAIALTDHGNLFGAWEFYQTAIKNDIKPIIGCEFYVAPTSRHEKNASKGEKTAYHLVLLAKNKTGYENLLKLSSKAYLEGFYYKPRIDKELLNKHHDGLICLSACLSGEIPHLILAGKTEKAIQTAEEYKNLFGEDFYLELQNHGLDDQKTVNKELISISKQLNIPIVATNDVHYIDREDAESHDMFLCIGTNEKVDNPDRKHKYDSDEFYLREPEEMYELFSEHPEALENTVKIAEKCELELTENSMLPNFDVPEGYTKETYLKHLCEEGLKKKFEKNITDEIKKRLDYELDVINRMGFPGYFLIVWDFIRHAKSKGIRVGPGRGSAAGSLVAYTLDITDLDPIKYKLLFERFLNPERISMPDIDIDFEDTRREEVINYVKEKYGEDHVAQIITFGTLKARAVIRDVGRVMDVPLGEVDKIAKMIPEGPKASLEKAYKENKELRELIDENPDYQTLYENAKKLEGLKRHSGTHAAGIIIGRHPLEEVVPLFKDQKTGSVSTQFEGTHLDKIGLLKMDFLGLKNLTIISNCLKLIKETRNLTIDINTVGYDDSKTFELLQCGNSHGVFQLESKGMQELMVRLAPTTFEDIIALIALYRPGPLNSGMADQFVERKHNPSKIRFDHPLLEDILKDTYGVIVYQEQVMEIARSIGGFSMGKADILRKAMGKKITHLMEELKPQFLEGAEKQNIDKKFAENLWDQLLKFAEYGFNKSHSAAYTVITYQTAYLKANYSLEYMASLLSSEKNNTDKLVETIEDCKRMNIKILPPDVNKSDCHFTIENDSIRFALSAVKNVGEGVVKSFVETRNTEGEFENLFDFCKKVDAKVANKKVLENLIKSGSMDCFKENRATLFSQINSALDYGQKSKADKERGQISLFGEEEIYDHSPESNTGKVKEWDTNEKLTYEKETLGFFISGHPIEKYIDKIKKIRNTTLKELKELKDGTRISVCGMITKYDMRIAKSGNPYALFIIEDESSSGDVMVFNSIFDDVKEHIDLGNVVYVKGRYSKETKSSKIFADEVIPLSEIDPSKKRAKTIHKNDFDRNETKKHKPKGTAMTEPKTAKFNLTKNDNDKQLHIFMISENSTQEQLEKLREIIGKYNGKSNIIFHLKKKNSHNGTKMVKAGETFKVSINNDLIEKVRMFNCVQNVDAY